MLYPCAQKAHKRRSIRDARRFVRRRCRRRPSKAPPELAFLVGIASTAHSVYQTARVSNFRALARSWVSASVASERDNILNRHAPDDRGFRGMMFQFGLTHKEVGGRRLPCTFPSARHAGAGGACNLAISPRISTNNFLGTATSAIWKMT